MMTRKVLFFFFIHFLLLHLDYFLVFWIGVEQ